MKIIITIIMIITPALCFADWQTDLEETGITPGLHAVGSGMASHFLVKQDFDKKWAFIVPVAIGLAKESLIDDNFGADDMVGNVIGSALGTWVTPGISFNFSGNGFFVKYTREF